MLAVWEQSAGAGVWGNAWDEAPVALGFCERDVGLSKGGTQGRVMVCAGRVGRRCRR